MIGTFKRALGIMIVTGSWATVPVNAGGNGEIRSGPGDEIASITLTRTGNQLALTGRPLRTGPHRERHTLVQIKEGENVLHELLLATERVSGSLRPVGRTAEPGVAVWIWGTDDALRAVRGVFGVPERDPRPPIDLDFGIEELTESSFADLPALDGIALLDLGDWVAVLLLDSKGVNGMRYVSDASPPDITQLYWICHALLSQQRMAGIEIPYVLSDCGDAVKTWPPPPSMRCCPKGCPECCCYAHNTCTSGSGSATCDRHLTCTCTGPDTCECGSTN